MSQNFTSYDPRLMFVLCYQMLEARFIFLSLRKTSQSSSNFKKINKIYIASIVKSVALTESDPHE